jgi:uncharacterized protein with beta-barrel porin domain
LKSICAGLGFNYANTNLALDGLPQSSNVESYSLGAYLRGDSKHLFVDGTVAIIRYNRALAKDVEADAFIAGGKIRW